MSIGMSENGDCFRCEWPRCGAEFRRKDHLTRHLRSHYDTRPYVCPREDCKQAFRTSWHLKRHVKRIHEEPHRCPTCNLAFIKKASLHRHIVQEHHGVHPYQCEKCRAGFFSEQGLNDHNRLHGTSPTRLRSIY